MVVVGVPVKLGSNGIFKPEIFVALKTLCGILTCWDILPGFHFLISLLLACLWFWHIPFPNHRDIHDYLRKCFANKIFTLLAKFQFETFHFPWQVAILSKCAVKDSFQPFAPLAPWLKESVWSHGRSRQKAAPNVTIVLNIERPG